MVVAAALVVGCTLIAVDLRAAEATRAKKPNKPFKVWFWQEPDLPRKKDMKANKLHRLIGSDYDEMWMSKTPVITAAVGLRSRYECAEFGELAGERHE